LRAGVIQMRSGMKPDANLAALAPLVAEAKAQGADYALTPEVTFVFPENRDGLAAVAGPFEDNPSLKGAAELAKTHRLHLHIGSLAVLLPDGYFANRSVLFSPEGEVVTTYDKIHLFDANLPGLKAYRESATYRGGAEARIAEVAGVTLGMSICYDVRFATLYTALANAGAEVIAVPAAFTVPTGEAHWETLLRARAIETGSYIIAAAQGGAHENGRSTYGHSMIIDPWGAVIAKLDHDEPGVAVADIDPARVADARGRVPSLANARAFSLSVNDRGASSGAER
jgi:predicted amidohydrolase